MTQQINKRKNSGVGGEQAPPRERLQVVHPTNVIAEHRDVGGVMQAVGRFQGMLADKRTAAADRQFKLDGSQGARDALLGKVDEDRVAASEAYASAAAKINADTLGRKFVNTSIQELDREAMSDDFDYEQWRQAKIGEFMESGVGNNKYAAETINQFASIFDQQAGAKYGAMQARKSLADQTDAVANNLLQRLDEGYRSPEQLARWKKEVADESGLFPDEIESIVGTQLLQRLGEAKDENEAQQFVAMAESEGLTKQVGWSDKFTKQLDASKARIEREKHQAMLADTERRLSVRTELGNMARNGQLSIAYLTKGEQSGDFTQDEVMWAWGQQQSELERQRREAQERSEKAAAEAEQSVILDRITSGTQEEMHAAIALGVKERDIKAHANKQYASAWLLATSEDEVESATGIKALQSMVKQSQQLGLMPEMMKDVLNDADVGVPRRFIRNAETFRKMEANGMGDFLKGNMDGASYAKHRVYRSLVEDAGMTPEAAVSSMADSAVPAEDAAKRLNQVQRDLLIPKTAEIADDLGVTDTGIVQRSLRGLVMPYLMQGKSEAESFQLAVSQFKDQYEVLDGYPISKAHTFGEGAALASAWETYRDDIMLPELKKSIGEDEVSNVRLAPMPNRPGHFLVYRPGDAAPLTRKTANGREFVTLKGSEIVRDAIEHKRRIENQPHTPVMGVPHR